jgi:hypothetical protein
MNRSFDCRNISAARWITLGIFAIGICASNAGADLTHRYSFNDAGAAKDSVGKIDGKLVGGATIADGKLTLKNDGKSSGDDGVAYLEFAGPILPKTGSVSIEVWFTAKDLTGFERVLNIGDHDSGEGQAFIYFTPKTADGQSRVAITATDTASKTAIDNQALDDGKEHMVAIVIDGTAKKIHFFVDGKEPTAASDLGDNTLDKVRQVDNWLGRSSFDHDPGYIGTIDELRIYDQPLSADEVAAAQTAGPDTLPTAAPTK